jgi:aspartate kinase
VAIVVQKYGGSSVGDVQRIGHVADRVAATKKAGRDVVVVVSAMGDTTDELLALAREVSSSPSRRELDMLLSAGERISMALLSMALEERGVPAVSFTGSQSGIITNDAHANARIVEVRPFRVQDELERGRVVIVAGYQGVSYKREVTTLGRGGSDTTAVALAAALEADACEIYSDVAGVFSADPRVVPGARRLAEISYEEMQELAEAGARVLNAQAVEFAKERGIAIYARATRGEDGETIVRRHPPRAPGRVVGVASEAGLVLLCAPRAGVAAVAGVLERLDASGAAGKQLRFDEPLGASLVLSLENVHDFAALRADLRARFPQVEVIEGVGAVSAIGAGINATFRNVREAVRLVEPLGAPILGVATSSFRVSLLMDASAVASAARRLHEGLVESPQPGAGEA